MKKMITLAASALVLMVANVDTANAQAVEEGNVIIDPYYGGPNFGKSLYQALLDSADDVKAIGVGPLGVRAEYLLSDKFGIGVDFIYNTNGIEYTDDVWTDDNNNGTVDNGEVDMYTYKVQMTRIRVQARFNYHFGNSDVLDTYTGVGIGTNMRKWTYDTDDPSYEEEDFSGTLLPFSMRIALGARYYFTDNIGLQAEIGIGGPLASGGLSIKF